jgi:hypothetical protein
VSSGLHFEFGELGRSLGVDPVAVAWGLTGYEHSDGGGTSIDCLMLPAGRDLKSFAGVKDEVVMLDLEGELSFQDEEKLTRVEMRMAGLAGAGRHEFFNDAELGCFDEVPAVAVGCLGASPLVVLGRFCADDLCGQSTFPEVHDFLMQMTVLP